MAKTYYGQQRYATAACFCTSPSQPSTAGARTDRTISTENNAFHRSARSACRSAKSSRSFITGFRAGMSFPADSGGLIHPWRTASSRRASETGELRPGVGGPSWATTRSRSVTKTVSPPAASRMYSLSLFLSSLMPTDLIAKKVATGGHSVNDAREYGLELRWR